MGMGVRRKGGNGGETDLWRCSTPGKLPSLEGSTNCISHLRKCRPGQLSHLSEILSTNGWRSLGWNPHQMPQLTVSSRSRLPGELQLRRGTLSLQRIQETKG